MNMASSSDSSAVEASPASSTAPSVSEATTLPTANGAAEKPPDDTSKLRMFLGILRKFIGVADIASVRFSLPAQLLEPRPNLEYWNYLDRPEYFAAIGDSEEPVDRMLEVLRFWFTKDLKYVKGKPVKPYNSTLGEFFRCNWEVSEVAPTVSLLKSKPIVKSAASSIKSVQNTPQLSRQASSIAIPSISLDKPIRISYLTEQTSHHPPVSAFYVDCPEKGLSAFGFDQLSAKFTGTSIRVMPGEYNLGVFINISKRDDEQYQLTHPAAHLGGLLRGSLSITVNDHCFVTCPKTKLKTILHYVEEGWLGRAQNRVEAAIFNYDPEDDSIDRIEDIPEKDLLVKIMGNWREKLYFSRGPKFTEKTQLVDLEPLQVAPKVVPPETSQIPNESLRFWSGVTEAIISRQFSRATVIKQEIEEKQREKAKERAESGVEWEPRFFTGSVTPVGRPELNAEGKDVLRDMQEGKWALSESLVLGA